MERITNANDVARARWRRDDEFQIETGQLLRSTGAPHSISTSSHTPNRSTSNASSARGV